MVEFRIQATRVAVLGMGIMGASVAGNLVRAGCAVSVWDRTPNKARTLADLGATVAASPAEAVTGADVVITMLTDGPAVEGVMTGADGPLQALPRDAVWVQMSTVGVAWTERLAALAKGHVIYVDAPVSGSSQPAKEGELLIFAAGPQQTRDKIQPLFDVIGRQTLWLSNPGDGSRLKLVFNTWLATLVEGMAEVVSLASAVGLDPRVFVDTLADSPMGSAYAVTKGRAMLDGQFTPGFPLQHAAKDAALAVAAAKDKGGRLPLTDALLTRWEEAIASGHGAEDVAAAITATALSGVGGGRANG